MCFRPTGVTKPVKCPKCGTWNTPTAKACKKCGFTGEEGTDSQNQAKTPAK